jgi:hypothetical protein
VTGRKRLGIGDVETGAADDVVAQRVDEVVGDDVLAPCDVDEPGVALHQCQLVGGDQTLGLRRQRQGEHDEVGAGQGVGVAVGIEDVVDWVEVGDDADLERAREIAGS